MARGWESKSVEAQQAEAAEPAARPRPALTRGQVAREREREGLLLCRSRVLQQLESAQNQRHRKMLEDALADLEAKLARLELRPMG
jgi:hypothetical protein